MSYTFTVKLEAELSKVTRQRPAYKIKDIREMINSGRYLVKPKPALLTAMRDFGFGRDDILGAIKKLGAGDFHKSATHEFIPGIMVDTYKKHNYQGTHNIFTHFHVQDNRLFIVSFKDIYS